MSSGSARRGAAKRALPLPEQAASSPFTESLVSDIIGDENWDYELPEHIASELGGQTSTSSARQEISDAQLRQKLGEIWGFKEFREGQLEAIKRIVHLQSTLVTVPTGSGKSLCYQLPAHILSEPGSITLVISPLISLMIDQLHKLPKQIRGVAIGSHQSSADVAAAERALEALGEVQVLFVSPERVVSKRFLMMLARLKLRVNFVCVDEAHCLSEWSHNFRPAYLTMCRVIKDVLQVKCVLALTATATRKTSESVRFHQMIFSPFHSSFLDFFLQICSALNIEDSPAAIIRCSPLRPNLKIQVHLAGAADRQSLLVKILKQINLKDKDCAIVYVQQQQRAENVAFELDSQGFSAVAYHAGMRPEQRRSVQDKFSRGLVRIVVATIAFGMGIDNAHVRAVIHVSLPKSVENYVQEIGRAGRDGKDAYCHLIAAEDDVLSLRSYAHADTQDRAQVKQLILQIFNQSKRSADAAQDPSTPTKPKGRFTKRATKHLSVILPIDATEMKLDMKRGVISTVLAWLEIRGLIKNLPTIHSTLEISFYSASLDKLRRKSNVMDLIWKLGKNSSRKGVVSVPLQQLSEEMNTEVADILLQLDQLAATSGDEDTPGIKYETKDPGFHIKILQQPQLDPLIDEITAKMSEMEASTVHKIDAMWNLVKSSMAAPEELRSGVIATAISDYFNSKEENPENSQEKSSPGSMSRLLAVDVRAFLSKCEAVKTPRQVARIFHGIPSPQFPSQEWFSNGFWGKRRMIDFNEIIATAKQAILNSRVAPRPELKAISEEQSAAEKSAPSAQPASSEPDVATADDAFKRSTEASRSPRRNSAMSPTKSTPKL